MTDPLRVAVLSAWHVHAGDYARRAREHPGTELVALWDDDAERGAAAAAQMGVEATGDLDALLARDDVGGVVVTTETTAHRDVIGRALAAGKHVFTEKLLAPTVAQSEELVAAAGSAGLALAVSLPRLEHGCTRALHEAAASGRLGRLTSARVRLSHDGAVRGWLPERFYDPAAAVGGALTDLGCHPVYLVQLLLGAEPEALTATYRSVTGRAVEDSAVVVASYAEGAIGVVETGFASPSPFTVEVSGTEGHLEWSEADQVLRGTGPAFGGAGWQELPVPQDGPDPFALWVERASAGAPDGERLARAVALTRFVVAANEAAASGRSTRP